MTNIKKVQIVTIRKIIKNIVGDQIIGLKSFLVFFKEDWAYEYYNKKVYIIKKVDVLNDFEKKINTIKTQFNKNIDEAIDNEISDTLRNKLDNLSKSIEEYRNEQISIKIDRENQKEFIEKKL